MAAHRRLHSLIRHSRSIRSSQLLVNKTDSTINRLIGTATAPNPVLHVSPTSGLADDLLDIRVSGLLPGQLATLQAEVDTECGRFKFRSSATYKADDNGQISVQRDPSLGGTYDGVEPMGLIWSCKPIPEIAHKYPRLRKQDSTRPLNYTINLLDGGETEQRILASTVAERRYLADYVERTSVTCGQAECVMFLPKQKGSSDPLPVVIDMRGLGSGVLEDRASLLASHGYAVFAFNYILAFEAAENNDMFFFKVDALLDIFKFIANHPRLDKERVGIFGFCSGSTLVVNALSWLDLPVKCAVLSATIDGLLCDIGMKLRNGRRLRPFGTLDDYSETYTKDGFVWFRSKNVTEEDFKGVDLSECVPPVENISVPLLFLINGDDQYAPTEERTLLIIQQLQDAGKGHLIESLHMPGTGHLLDAPYMPIVTQSALQFPTRPHPYFTNWGGTQTPYAHAVEGSWHRMLDYFKMHLKPTETYR